MDDSDKVSITKLLCCYAHFPSLQKPLKCTMLALLTICHRDNLVQESGPSSVGNDTEKVKKANARDKVLLRMPGIKEYIKS